MILFQFTKYAEKQLNKLEERQKKQIVSKLTILKNKQLFMQSLKSVHNILPATHRLRIGNYRILVEYTEGKSTCLVLKIGHRKDVYL